MKIALCDLNHKTLGIHTNTIPLGIGEIAYYMKKTISASFDIRLFKDPVKCKKELLRWKPDVMGISQYSWNSELNLFMARLVKDNNPHCAVVAGGPNLFVAPNERKKFLKKNRAVDVCVNRDGEIPFAGIVERLLRGEDIASIRENPGAGTYSYDPKIDRVVESDEPAPRLKNLDIFGSMYAEGFFDSLLDEGYHPFLQTQRGCPFTCAYCYASNPYCSKIIFQSPENFRKDLEYLGKRYEKQHNVTLHIANTNFSLFKEDVEIAHIIRAAQDKYDWPKNIDVNFGSDPGKLLALLEILKYKLIPSIALQTLTPRVLKSIRRKNIPLDEFMKFQKTATSQISPNTVTELILSLPNETEKSFLKTISDVLNSGVQNIVIYTLMSLRGTPLDSPEFTGKYKHKFRYRIVPRCFSDIDGNKIFETEKVVVSTKYMPFKDYLHLRGLAFIITAFASSNEFFPLRKYILEKKMDLARWIFLIHRDIHLDKELSGVYEDFLAETKAELYASSEAVRKFFSDQEKYKALRDGKYGDNLLRKYKTIALSRHYDALLTAAFRALDVLLKNGKRRAEDSVFLDDLKVYLKSRFIGDIFSRGYAAKFPKEVVLHYDIPRWLALKEDGPSAKESRRNATYEMIVTDYMKDRLKSYNMLNNDPTLSLQIMYRDGLTEDLWPQWKAVR